MPKGRRGVQGKPKGNAYENRTAKALSRWFTDGQDSTQLIRSVLSGGWASRRERQAGDLAANGEPGEIFRKHFIVECKHRRAIDFYHWYTQAPSDQNLAGWWLKLCKESDDTGLMPLLIFRRNNFPEMIGSLDILFHDIKTSALVFLHPDRYALHCIEFKRFLAYPPEYFYQRVQEWMK